MTMTLISTVAVPSGGSAQIDLNSIPSTFDDLILVVSARVTNVGIYEQDLAITFNSNTSNRTCRRLFGNAGSNGLSQSRSDLLIGQVVSALAATPSFSVTTVYISNYKAAVPKTYSSDSSQIAGDGTSGMWGNLLAGVWNDTTAINSIQVLSSSGTFVQHSIASLYGVTRGSSGGVVVS